MDLEELQDILDIDVSWRIQDMSMFESILLSHEQKEEKYQVLARQGISLLYSHFEGFIKFATRKYIKHIASQGRRISELNHELLSLQLNKITKGLSQGSDYFGTKGVIDFYKNDSEHFSVDPEKLSFTSNLSFSEFKRIAWIIGLNDIDYLEAGTNFDKILIPKRHAIAHGEKVIIENGTFNSQKTIVVKCIQSFKGDICRMAQSNSYLRRTQGHDD